MTEVFNSLKQTVTSVRLLFMVITIPTEDTKRRMRKESKQVTTKNTNKTQRKTLTEEKRDIISIKTYRKQ